MTGVLIYIRRHMPREETTVACEFVCSSLATFVQSKTAVGFFFFLSLVDLYNIRHIHPSRPKIKGLVVVFLESLSAGCRLRCLSF